MDLKRRIGAIEELLRRSLGENIKLSVAAGEDLWFVRRDGNQLENALPNLAINARDAMPDGGTMTIDIANKELDGNQARQRDVSAGEYVRLRVIDTGVGMPPSVKARAFDPFYTTKPIGKGTGLGLSMIYGFVRQSDGSVTIDSEFGKGTSVEIYLPRYKGDVVDAPVEEDSGDHRAKANEVVLIVEDEAVVRLLIVETLNDLGYQALETADSGAALRILQSSQRRGASPSLSRPDRPRSSARRTKSDQSDRWRAGVGRTAHPRLDEGPERTHLSAATHLARRIVVGCPGDFPAGPR